MDFPSILMTTGLCLIVGCAVFLAATVTQALRQGGLRLTDDQRGMRLDLLMSVLWFGALLVQVSNLMFHAEPRETFNLTGLTVTAFAGVVFICGVFAGRLFLRLEMRRLSERRENENCEARV